MSATVLFHPRLRLPAALLKVWIPPSSEEVFASARQAGAWRPGITWLRPDLCAVTPVAGDPAVHDAAIAYAHEISRHLEGALPMVLLPGRVEGRAGDWTLEQDPLVDDLERHMPVSLHAGGEAAGEPAAGSARRPRLFLTSRSAGRLEAPRLLDKSGTYDGPSGRRIPLLAAGEEIFGEPAVRNREVLRRRIPWIARPEVESSLAERGPLLRVSGLPGCGKSRAVHRALVAAAGGVPSAERRRSRRLGDGRESAGRESGGPGAPERRAFLWVAARPSRRPRPSLAAQLVHALILSGISPGELSGVKPLGLDTGALAADPGVLVRPEEVEAGWGRDWDLLLADGEAVGRLLPVWLAQLAEHLRSGGSVGTGATTPLTVVLDDMETAGGPDAGVADALAAAASAGAAFRLIAVGRSGTAWSETLRRAPDLRVPPFRGEEADDLSDAVLSGLDMPPRMVGRLRESSAGIPFALEEALAALVHQDLVRQVYGSFFYRGGPEQPYLASERLIEHVEAEARRLGQAERLRWLAAAEGSIAARALIQAGSDGSEITLAGGDEGEATDDWSSSVLRAGWLRGELGGARGERELSFTVPAFCEALAATWPTGERMKRRQELGEALEDLGSGSAWGRYRLLAGSARGPAALAAAVQAGEASPEQLTAALERELQAEEGDELERLWQLLPVAHRLGRLPRYRSYLDRALALARDDPRRHLAFAGLRAELCEQEGDLRAAEEVIRGALARPQEGGGARKAEAVLVLRLGRLLLRQERHEEARRLLEQVAPVLEGAGAALLAAGCHFYLGNTALRQNRLEDALALHRRALAARRGQAKPELVGASLSALGETALRMGRYPQALAFYQEAETLFIECGDNAELTFALLGTGKAHNRLGSYVEASGPLRRALDLRERHGDPTGIALARLAVAESYLYLGRPETALQAARQADFDLKMLRTQGSAGAQAEQLLGRISLAQRQLTRAISHLERALEMHRGLGAWEDVVLDQAWLLDAALVLEDETLIRYWSSTLTTDLASNPSDRGAEEGPAEPVGPGDQRGRERYIEQREKVEYRLFRAVKWLARGGAVAPSGLEHLRRAYRELMEKSAHLDPAQRHTFLHQVGIHRDILSDATTEGLSLPELG